MYPEITQREVAKRLKLSPSAVNLWTLALLSW